MLTLFWQSLALGCSRIKLQHLASARFCGMFSVMSDDCRILSIKDDEIGVAVVKGALMRKVLKRAGANGSNAQTPPAPPFVFVFKKGEG